MFPRLPCLGVMFLGAAFLCLFGCNRRAQRPLPKGPLTHEAYIWQRVHDARVSDAVDAASGTLDSFCVLAAEISWRGEEPSIVRVPVDYKSLIDSGRPVGLALRIGPFPGPYDPHTAATDFVVTSAKCVVADAVASGLDVAELQIDFDCATSKLDGYREWLVAIREAVPDVPLVITTLPSWIWSRKFADLIEATDSYILQVHSLEKPTSVTAIPELCDLDKAKRWIKAAGKHDIPFRVALPTYGYLLAFDRQGDYIGLSTQGPKVSWPRKAQLRDLRADAGKMAELLGYIHDNRPPYLQGVIWYRLPIAGEPLNWRWRTLAAIIAGDPLAGKLDVSVRQAKAGLIDIHLENNSNVDLPLSSISLTWPGNGLLAMDSLNDYRLIEKGAGCQLDPLLETPGVLPAGERKHIAWLRFDEEKEVTAHAYSR